ncbi:dof zinc finger protein DOF4.6 isoform X2 [Prunus yedoensis var. nudiflora]|uniref:Dof zinc finger protein DOF4.6 isoform X2 n=1 Tax=Prunus yedoensis var. nudiflora TaxID=2094558 RepID=A0A314Z0S1_PRUYE|nr:dof zinc finger protein DOF4.6 isoform X2 [Prunus yedoensis var. nudiflora]
MELLKNGIASRGLASFMPMGVPDHSNNNNITMFSTGFPMGVQEFKPSHGLSFSLDGFESSGYGCLQGVQEANNSHARLLFPTDEDLKQQIPSTTTATTEFDQHTRGEGDSGAYWNGMLGGGSW